MKKTSGKRVKELKRQFSKYLIIPDINTTMLNFRIPLEKRKHCKVTLALAFLKQEPFSYAKAARVYVDTVQRADRLSS